MGTVAGGSTASSSLIVESTTGSGTSDYIAWRTAAQAERMRLLTGGTLLINGTVAYGEASRGHQLELQTSAANYGGIAMTNWSAGGYDHILDFQMAKSNTPGTYSAVTTNDTLGRIRWLGADGDQFVEAGAMYFQADAAVSNNIVPGRWSLYTSNASGASVEALRIDSTQTTITKAGTTTSAPLRIPHGSAPTSPTDGDIWTTTAGLYVRINGVTVGPLS